MAKEKQEKELETGIKADASVDVAVEKKEKNTVSETTQTLSASNLIKEFERAIDKAALTKEEYELIDYIRYSSVFTQPSLIKDLKRPSKPPLLSNLCQICK